MAFLPLSGAIAYVIPHGKVHLTIGLTNDLYNNLVEVFPEGKAWAERLHLQRADYFGGTWEGRQCNTLLANVQVLQDVVTECNQPRRALRSDSDSNQEQGHVAQPFVKVFQSLRVVRTKCFGVDLKDGWEESITDFEEKFSQAGLTRFGRKREHLIWPILICLFLIELSVED